MTDPSRPSGAAAGVAAAIALAAGAAATAGAPWILRAPLGFLLMAVIPGWILGRRLLPRAGAEELGMASLVFSVPLTIAARTLIMGLGAGGTFFVAAWSLLCAAAALLLRPRSPSGGHPDRVAWWLAGALALLVVLPAAVNPAIRTWGDAMFHGKVVYEILPRVVPAQDPAFAGIPLVYQWILHVWVAALVQAMGVGPYAAFFWVNGAMMAAAALGIFRLASVLWTRALPRRLSPAVVVLGMNALGWVTCLGVVLASPLLGENKGAGELREAFQALIVEPSAGKVSAALIFHAYFALATFLYKYMCVNALASGLTLSVASFVFAVGYLREGTRSRWIAVVLAAATMAAVHPMVGAATGVGLFAAMLLAGVSREVRRRAASGALAVVAGMLLAAPVILLMAGGSAPSQDQARIHPSSYNLIPLVQALLVVAVPALVGWREVRRRDPVLARFGLGFALAVTASAFLMDFAYNAEAYIVYVAYLGVAYFAAGGFAALVERMRARGRGRLAWALIALLLLPTPLFHVAGFARHSPGAGVHGYPDSPDEFAVFDYLRDETPPDAVVLDSQVFYSPAATAYSGRATLFGGMWYARTVGYPMAEMKRRERALVNLFFEPGVAPETEEVIREIQGPVYVLVRREIPLQCQLPVPEDRIQDPVAKFDALPAFEAVVRTPSMVLYRRTGG